jgi:hypothetical protein
VPAAELDEGLGAPWPTLMDDPSDQPLARTGLGLDQDGGSRCRDVADLVPHPGDRAGAPGESLEAESLVEAFFDLGEAPRLALVGERAFEHGREVVAIDRAVQDSGRAGAQRVDHALGRHRIGDEHDAEIGVVPAGPLQYIHAVDARRFELRHDGVEGPRVERPKRRLAVTREGDLPVAIAQMGGERAVGVGGGG